MEDSVLLKISLTISILGIFVLLTISNALTPRLTKISSINKDLINQKIKIQGEVINIKNYNPDFQVLTIKDSTGKINIILNNNLKYSNLENLNKNQTINIIGEVKKYKQELQIQADKITLS